MDSDAERVGAWESSLAALASQHAAKKAGEWAKHGVDGGVWDVGSAGSVDVLVAAALLQGSDHESGRVAGDSCIPREYALSLAALGSRDTLLSQLRASDVLERLADVLWGGLCRLEAGNGEGEPSASSADGRRSSGRGGSSSS